MFSPIGMRVTLLYNRLYYKLLHVEEFKALWGEPYEECGIAVVADIMELETL